MRASEIRIAGIPAPSDSFCQGDAVGDNLGLLVGAMREIAAQLAELNEKIARIGMSMERVGR